jgi:hypothetical protein
MLGRYHEEITRRSIGSFFTSVTLAEIVGANVGQDTFTSLLGVNAHRHVCDCTVAESLAYIDEEHAYIADIAQYPDSDREQRTALGRLLHTVQDFYAHTNYVVLWLAQNAGIEPPDVAQINEFDPRIVTHPALRIAQWVTWRDPLYYVPLLGSVLRRFWLPEGSHEALHLDSPDRGLHFHFAMSIARQRTRTEYMRAVAAIREVGGAAALARFHGALAYAPAKLPAISYWVEA